MTPHPPPTLEDVVRRLPELVEKMRAAGRKSATVDDHRAAFTLGCELLAELIDCLAQKGSPLDAVDASKGFSLSIANLKQLVDAETEVLRRMNLPKEEINALIKLLRAMEKNGELRDLEVTASRTIDVLSSLRDSFCVLASVTERGQRVPPEILDLASDSVLDTCLIAGDVVAIPVGAAAGPPGLAAALLLAVASVGSGVKSIAKKLGKLRELIGKHKKDQVKGDQQRESSAQIQALVRRNKPLQIKKKKKKS